MYLILEDDDSLNLFPNDSLLKNQSRRQMSSACNWYTSRNARKGTFGIVRPAYLIRILTRRILEENDANILYDNNDDSDQTASGAHVRNYVFSRCVSYIRGRRFTFRRSKSVKILCFLSEKETTFFHVVYHILEDDASLSEEANLSKCYAFLLKRGLF